MDPRKPLSPRPNRPLPPTPTTDLVEKYTPAQLDKAARIARENEAAFIRALDGLTDTKLDNFALLVSQKEGAPDLPGGVWITGADGETECHFEKGQALDYIRLVWAWERAMMTRQMMTRPKVFTADGWMKQMYTAKGKGPREMPAIVDLDG